MKLWYLDGSPFARMIRATLLEFNLHHQAVELSGFPPKGIDSISPSLQVPVLQDDGQRLFGSDVIRSYVHAKADATGDLSVQLTRPDHHWEDLQTLSAIHTLGEALVQHHYALWAGVRPTGRNALGVVPADRSMERAHSLLDWLETRIVDGRFWSRCLSAADIALASILTWTDSREPIAWRGRHKIEGLVENVERRPSMIATRPRPMKVM